MPDPVRRAVARVRSPWIAEGDLHGDDLVRATLHDAGFALGDSCYHALHAASDGGIYLAIGSKRADTAARLFAFDPAADEVRPVADMNAATGESDARAIAQGKVHTPLVEHDGRLLFATHVGCYQRSARRERIARVPGRAPYPGGHFVALDLADATVASLARAPREEGIIAAALDADRAVLYGLTWPGALLVRHRLGAPTLEVIGAALGEGERGHGRAWTHVCRTLALDPETGDVFLTDPRGTILVLRNGKLGRYERCTFAPGGVPQAWRTIRWCAGQSAFVGLAMRTGALFRFRPESGVVEQLARLEPPMLRDTAWWRTRPKATLGFHVDERSSRIRYLATGPALVAADGRRVRSVVYLATCTLDGRDLAWHGPLRLADGRFPTFAQSLTARAGRLYTVAWIELPADTRDERVQSVREVRREHGVPEPHGELEEVNLLSFADPLTSIDGRHRSAHA